MTRIFAAALFGLTAAGLTFFGAGATGSAAAQQKDQPKAQDYAQHFMDCAKACDDCARICEACAAHCAKLLSEGKTGHLRTLQTCQDCATICAAASSVVAKQGPFSDLICTACADACKRCGDACAEHPNDPLMKQCAEECRRCEKACRDMLRHLQPGGPK
jgi:hypothetical protein